jgi:integrase
MAKMKITKRAVDAAPVPTKGDTYYWDTELRGFGLRVTPRGVRSYVVQYRLPGRPARRTTIGIHGSPWTPETAEKRARAILFDVKVGDDPVVAARKRERAAVDLEFSKYVETFSDTYLRREWGDSWGDSKRQLELHVIPQLKGRSLPEIERYEVSAVINRLRDRPALARNTHAVLRKLFAWAVDQGDLAVSPICAAPPMVKARKRVLTPDEVVAVWQASFGLNRPMGEFVRMLVITLQRRNEVAEMPWSELSQANAMWRLHGDRAKNDTDHLVPLNPPAIDLLNRMAMGPVLREGATAKPWPHRGFVFSTTGSTPISGFSKVKARLDALIVPILQKLADDRADALGVARERVALHAWRLHDIRRTGTTQMQALGVPIEVTEKVINHRSGETAGIRGVYNLHAYSDEKRKALDAWAEYLDRLIKNANAPNVITLAGRRA